MKYAAGMHWTQRPENKEKVAALGRKGARSRSKRDKMLAVAKMLATKAQRYSNGHHGKSSTRETPAVKGPAKSKPSVLVINGWRISLSPDEIRIDNE